jgi:DNA-binding MarR family transcriptional regulator
MLNKSDLALIALRKILRVTEQKSRALANQSGLTPSQLIILQIIGKLENAVPSVIAREATLTQATVTSLIDKLERQGMVNRRRDTEDRRRVFVDLTDKGREALAGAPDLLQERFQSGFSKLPEWEQFFLISALERVASMLGAEDIDAAPVLDVGAIDKPARRD